MLKHLRQFANSESSLFTYPVIAETGTRKNRDVVVVTSVQSARPEGLAPYGPQIRKARSRSRVRNFKVKWGNSRGPARSYS